MLLSRSELRLMLKTSLQFLVWQTCTKYCWSNHSSASSGEKSPTMVLSPWNLELLAKTMASVVTISRFSSYSPSSFFSSSSPAAATSGAFFSSCFFLCINLFIPLFIPANIPFVLREPSSSLGSSFLGRAITEIVWFKHANEPSITGSNIWVFKLLALASEWEWACPLDLS